MFSKYSNLVHVGSLVYLADGGSLRCASKLASSDSFTFKLVDSQGKNATTSSVSIIPQKYAKIASWMRYVVAYNQDFDLYVKSYIEQAGLPVDPSMDWAKWFEAKISPKLMSKDPEVKDEAIHHIIIKTLVERNALSKFQSAIKKFPAEVQLRPLDKQVRSYLIQCFTWRIKEANDYIKKVIHQENTDSMWAESENNENLSVNTLDREEFADKGNFNEAEVNAEMSTFRKGFASYLSKTCKPEKTKGLLVLFDLLVEEMKASSDRPSMRDIKGQWMSQYGEKAISVLNYLFKELPKLVSSYVSQHLDVNYLHPFIQILRSLGGHSVNASSKKAEDFAVNHTIDPEVSNQNESSSPVSSLVSEAGGVAEEVAPLLVAASSQWQLPTCKLCGRQKQIGTCPACQDNFCGECLPVHHSNNPSHDRIASKVAQDTSLATLESLGVVVHKFMASGEEHLEFELGDDTTGPMVWREADWFIRGFLYAARKQGGSTAPKAEDYEDPFDEDPVELFWYNHGVRWGRMASKRRA